MSTGFSVLTRWSRVWGVGIAIIGSGVLLFKYTTPTKEQMIAKLSPELREQYYREREMRIAEHWELMEKVKKTAASNDPAWMTADIKAPWEQRNDTNIKEAYLKAEAERKSKERVEKMKQDLDIVNESKK